MSSFLRSTITLALLFFASLTLSINPRCANPSTPVEILLCSQEAAFGGSLVVPQFIPSFDPTGVLHLVYGNVDVGGAQQMAPERVSSTPIISFTAITGSFSGPNYLILFVDIDSTTGPILQWLQTGLTMTTTATGLLTSSVPPAAYYNGPAPVQGAGTQRYVALLYTQPNGFSLPAAYANMPSTPLGGSARVGFNLANFVAATGLGAPVGGNFFKSTWDGQTPANTVHAPIALPPSTAVITSLTATPSTTAIATGGNLMTTVDLSILSSSESSPSSAVTSKIPVASTLHSFATKSEFGFGVMACGVGAVLALGEAWFWH